MFKLQRYKEAVDAYDAGLLDFRDPEAVKLRSEAEEKRKVSHGQIDLFLRSARFYFVSLNRKRKHAITRIPQR